MSFGKFVFKYYFPHNEPLEIYAETTIYEDSLPEIILRFHYFLKGCGFEFDGNPSDATEEQEFTEEQEPGAIP